MSESKSQLATYLEKQVRDAADLAALRRLREWVKASDLRSADIKFRTDSRYDVTVVTFDANDQEHGGRGETLASAIERALGTEQP